MNRFHPKKTEKLEVRLPPETKQAFVARCRSEGRSASDAVRGFIEDFLARSPKPVELPMIVRSPYTYVGIAAAAVIGVTALSAAPSRAEPNFGEIFKSLDRDGDGRLSALELAPPSSARSAGAEAGSGRATLSADLAEMDTNRDGGVSLAEFTAFNRASIQTRFLALDADSDGQLTLAELERRGAPLSEAGPGLAIDGPPGRLLAKLDANRDGSISQTEFVGSR